MYSWIAFSSEDSLVRAARTISGSRKMRALRSSMPPPAGNSRMITSARNCRTSSSASCKRPLGAISILVGSIMPNVRRLMIRLLRIFALSALLTTEVAEMDFNIAFAFSPTPSFSCNTASGTNAVNGGTWPLASEKRPKSASPTMRATRAVSVAAASSAPESGASLEIAEGFSIRSRTSSPAFTPSCAARRSFSAMTGASADARASGSARASRAASRAPRDASDVAG